MDKSQYWIYGSHLPALTTAIFKTEGRILEIGTGHASTPLFHELTNATKRYVLSLERNEKYLLNAAVLIKENHQIRHYLSVEQILPVIKDGERWSIVFVDCDDFELEFDKKGQCLYKDRVRFIGALRTSTDIIVLHDVETPNLAPLVKKFKYKKIFKFEGVPDTALLSDTIDFSDKEKEK